MISIVTIFRNEGKALRDTLESIKAQTFSDWECIMIDGRSTDDSPEIAAEFAAIDPRFKYHLQKHAGISNAFNLGIEQARGEFIQFLNGGDLFRKTESLAAAWEIISRYKDSITCLRTEYATEAGVPLRKFFPEEGRSLQDLFKSCCIAHPSTYIPMTQMEKIGYFSPGYKVAMDYELWLRAASMKIPINFRNEIITLHRTGGLSFQNSNRGRVECVAARLLYLGLKRIGIIRDFLILMRVLLRKN